MFSGLWCRFAVGDNFTDNLRDRGSEMVINQPDPFVPFLLPVSSTFARKGEDYLSGIAGIRENRERDNLIADGIFTRFDVFYCCKQDIFRGNTTFDLVY